MKQMEVYAIEEFYQGYEFDSQSYYIGFVESKLLCYHKSEQGALNHIKELVGSEDNKILISLDDEIHEEVEVLVDRYKVKPIPIIND